MDKNKQTLYVMIGLPASGKSLYSREVSDNATIVSSDKVREKIFGDENIQGGAVDIFKVVHDKILEAIFRGEDVVFDATNISYKHRRQLLQKVRKYKVRTVGVLVATPIDEVKENNLSRDRKVPEYVIDRMLKSFYVPFWGEGWDDIEIIWNNQRRLEQNLVSKIQSLMDFDQESPHHEHSLGEHLSKVADALQGDDLSLIGLLHDIGKEFTKTFRNTKGEVGKVAHYYGHENASAYLALFYLRALGCSNEYIINAVTRIQFHMRPYNAKTEKSKRKLIGLVGKGVYEDLLKINRADSDAH